MRVLLTGGGGFLGKYIQEELKKSDIDYIVYDRIYSGSLEQSDNLWDFMENSPEFTHIIHLAAKVGGIGANKKYSYDFIANNLRMGLNVIEVAKGYGLKVLMASTVCGYPSEPKTIPFVESELWDGYPEKTNAPYGIAKRTLTEVLWAANKQYGLESITLNLANMYGVGDSEDLVNSHVIPALVKKIKIAKEKDEKVELWGDGTPSRDFLHVSDAARAFILALDKPQGPQFGINIGTGIETSIFSVVYTICEALNFPLTNVVWQTSLPNGQQRRCLDTTLSRELLGWSPSINLFEGLKELCL